MNVGDRVAQFVVREVVPRAGEGQSYLVDDELTAARLVLRFLDHDDPLVRNYLEWLNAHPSALERAGLVNFAGVRTTGERAYVTRPFVEGIAMSELLSAGLPSSSRASRYCARLGDRIASGHRAGLVHGNLKPSNVILAPNDQLFLVDLSLAPAADSLELRARDLVGLGDLYYQLFTGVPRSPSDSFDPRERDPDIAPTTAKLVRELLQGRIYDAEELLPKLAEVARDKPAVVAYPNPKTLPASEPEPNDTAGESRAEASGTPLPSRVVNTWFEGDLPLRVERPSLLKLCIGRHRDESAAGAVAFREPDFGAHDHLDLLVSYFGNAFTFSPRQHVLRLDKVHDSNIAVSQVVPKRSGRCEIEVVISLARELDVLQELIVPVDVSAPETNPGEPSDG